jgi:hypothetical protein
VDTTEKTPDGKQIYEKPKLRVIELAAEEVMATGCKILGGTSIGRLGLPCASNQCVTLGGS